MVDRMKFWTDIWPLVVDLFCEKRFFLLTSRRKPCWKHLKQLLLYEKGLNNRKLIRQRHVGIKYYSRLASACKSCFLSHTFDPSPGPSSRVRVFVVYNCRVFNFYCFIRAFRSFRTNFVFIYFIFGRSIFFFFFFFFVRQFNAINNELFFARTRPRRRISKTICVWLYWRVSSDKTKSYKPNN